MGIKHHMGALLEEKAGLKAWLRSKAKRSIFSSPWMGITPWSQGEQDGHHALAPFPQESEKGAGMVPPVTFLREESRKGSLLGRDHRSGANKLPSQQTTRDEEKGACNPGGAPEAWEGKPIRTPKGSHRLRPPADPGLLFCTKTLTCFATLG